VVFAGAGPEVAKCLRRYGDLDIPELRVRLALASDGSVTRTELVNNRLLVSLHRCVRPALLRMQFAPGPTQEVEYSYSNVADGYGSQAGSPWGQRKRTWRWWVWPAACLTRVARPRTGC
jgi:hypothetical protein